MPNLEFTKIRSNIDYAEGILRGKIENLRAMSVPVEPFEQRLAEALASRADYQEHLERGGFIDVDDNTHDAILHTFGLMEEIEADLANAFALGQKVGNEKLPQALKLLNDIRAHEKLTRKRLTEVKDQPRAYRVTAPLGSAGAADVTLYEYIAFASNPEGIAAGCLQTLKSALEALSRGLLERADDLFQRGREFTTKRVLLEGLVRDGRLAPVAQ